MQFFCALEVTFSRIPYRSGCVTLVEYRNRCLLLLSNLLSAGGRGKLKFYL